MMSASVAHNAVPVAVPSGAEGDFAAFVRSFSDVTARLQETHGALTAQVERLQKELAEANERLRRSRSLAALGEMAAGIAHEIRNPLGAISLNAELLKDDVADRPDAAASVDKIRRATERLEHIVGDVLSFARDTRVNAQPTSAKEIFAMALADCEGLLEREDVDYRVDVDGACELEADGALVAQAVSNLVRNAVEAMSGADRREITLAAREARLRTPDGSRRTFVVLAVEDTGPGIPAEARERIFNPFFTTRETGTGLGLAIVHRIVDAHGGMTACADASHAAAGRGTGARLELSLPLEPVKFAAADGVSLGEAVRRRIGGGMQVHSTAG
ncbi:MAG: ATP-binding protein [Planctomycetaceae bacterium]|nr:ATP-binding protein [Planctomycetaceae bacterium]